MKVFRALFRWVLFLVLASQCFNPRTAFAQEKLCKDVLTDCEYFFNVDECNRYSDLARKYCSETCDLCPTLSPTLLPACRDMLPDCAEYIKNPSQCHGAREFFTKYCPRTCGYCECNDILDDCSSYVTDPNQCESSPFFSKYCRKTCKICESWNFTTPTTNQPVTSAVTAPSTTTSSRESTSTESANTSTLTPTVTTQTTTVPIPPGSIGCVDSPDCTSMIENDRELCKKREEFMKEYCPESCGFCDDDSYCEDEMPEECSFLFERDEAYCKFEPEYMEKNCAKTCGLCDCRDILPVCASIVANNGGYCEANPVFMKTNCPRSCNLCKGSNGNVRSPSPVGCVDKRKQCAKFARVRNYCSYQAVFMRENCPKSCQFCQKEYNFAINTEWNGSKINHSPITFQISAQDSRTVRISVSGPFFNEPNPPPCNAGAACDGLWDFEVAEVFFLGEREKYLEIELSPHGQHLLLLLNGVRKKFLDKLPINYTATIDRAKNTWNGTADIPIDYFPPGVRKINAYAIHGSGNQRKYESLYPASADVINPDFHRLEFFKPFDFDAMFTFSWSKPQSHYWKNVKRLLRARFRA
ncbi:uncharacterized protein LOC111332003 isoform X2 [Stylophora pistillata]|uniref:uncharacterized protein LOC111332003 isoform X2 n=1 Tax=Stylophora pistillata TaxID=50429 RepID=UPI000C052450|nr:uncharacterized protein LOC111332003 isoform X2 [Stylophora pistillata]